MMAELSPPPLHLHSKICGVHTLSKDHWGRMDAVSFEESERCKPLEKRQEENLNTRGSASTWDHLGMQADAFICIDEFGDRYHDVLSGGDFLEIHCSLES